MSGAERSESSILHGPAAGVVHEAGLASNQPGQPASDLNNPSTGSVEDFKTNQGSFAQQVKGYAKEFSGKVFNKEHEVQQGQAVRRGDLSTEEAKEQLTKENVAP